MKKALRLAALVLLMTGIMTACTPEQELAGSAWGNYVSGTDSDGDHYTATYTMVLNTSSSGMLFLSISYADDEMPFCFAMPLTYTWDDNQGTATATLTIPEEGTMSFNIPLSWSKTTGLQASFSSIEHTFEIGGPIELEQKSFAKPSSMEGTTWTMNISGDDEEYNYELKFVNATGAVLNLALVEGDYTENLRWNINYNYSAGIGTTSIYADGETVKGGFYMPDENTMLFSDGENGLLLTKQQ
ncbi:MAG: hypothetical protein IJQ14_06200 [Bacteroidales bacterium]|nr:hypothetical protein [Bacteroidales bacterium]